MRHPDSTVVPRLFYSDKPGFLSMQASTLATLRAAKPLIRPRNVIHCSLNQLIAESKIRSLDLPTKHEGLFTWRVFGSQKPQNPNEQPLDETYVIWLNVKKMCHSIMWPDPFTGWNWKIIHPGIWAQESKVEWSFLSLALPSPSKEREFFSIFFSRVKFFPRGVWSCYRNGILSRWIMLMIHCQITRDLTSWWLKRLPTIFYFTISSNAFHFYLNPNYSHRVNLISGK